MDDVVTSCVCCVLSMSCCYLGHGASWDWHFKVPNDSNVLVTSPARTPYKIRGKSRTNYLQMISDVTFHHSIIQLGPGSLHSTYTVAAVSDLWRTQRPTAAKDCFTKSFCLSWQVINFCSVPHCASGMGRFLQCSTVFHGGSRWRLLVLDPNISQAPPSSMGGYKKWWVMCLGLKKNTTTPWQKASQVPFPLKDLKGTVIETTCISYLLPSGLFNIAIENGPNRNRWFTY